MKVECPKCKSKAAWIRKTEYDLILMCMCGIQKVLFTTLVDTLEGPLGEDEEDPESDAKLPRMGTNLYKTLVVLSVLPEGSSRDITDRLNELNGLLRAPGLVRQRHLEVTVSDVSSYLTILRGKGLVDRTTNKRGVVGGSTWIVTQETVELLGLED